jgi:hypothetical protein
MVLLTTMSSAPALLPSVGPKLAAVIGYENEEELSFDQRGRPGSGNGKLALMRTVVSQLG